MIEFSFWLIDGIQTGTTTLRQSGSGSNCNEVLHHILQSSRTEVSLTDSLVSLVARDSYPSAELQSAYSKAPADTAVQPCPFFFPPMESHA